MKKENKITMLIAIGFIIGFIVWTVLVTLVDVKEIGPINSKVGFSKFNEFFHNITGVNLTLYNITDWLGLVPIVFAFGFAILGLVQWIKRKNILKVDFDILVLGGFYIIIIMVYIIFESLVINHRPVLINGYLEAAYPSSTTMLVMCVMPTAMMQFNSRIKNKMLLKIISLLILAFIVFMVFARLISGVHWITDIIGGGLISTGLVMMYYSLIYNKSINKNF